MARKLFPVWRLGKGNALRAALDAVPGGAITVAGLGEVVVDRAVDEAIGGLIPTVADALSKAAGGVGVFVIPTPEQAVEGQREDEALAAIVEQYGGNPFAPRGIASHNLTAQVELTRNNPALAKKLRELAEGEAELYAKALAEKRKAVKAAHSGNERYFNTGNEDTDARRLRMLG